MPFRRTVNITGLSTSDPLPGTPSEIEFTPGSGAGGGSPPPTPGPTPFFALYSDVPASITSSAGVVSAWGSLTQATSGNRPLLVTDTVSGIAAIRFDTGKTLSIAGGGVLDALALEGTTLIVVWRNRKFLQNVEVSILDSSGGEAHTGFRLIAKDQPGSGYYREMRARVVNGTSVVLDGPATPIAWNAFTTMRANVTAVTTTPTRSNLTVDHIESYDIAGTFVFPGGSVGAAVLGGSQIDIFCVLAYSTLSDVDRTAEIARVAERFQVDVVRAVAGDGIRHIGIPGSCILDNGDILCSYRNAADHAASPPGWLETRRSSDGGVTWGAAYEMHDLSDPVVDIRDCCLTQLANGDVLINYFTTDAFGYANVQIRRSTDGGHTFGAAQTLGPYGYTEFEACSAPIAEDPLNPGTLYLPGYFKNLGARSVGVVVKSTNNGATWGAPTVICDGVADNSEYYEPSLTFLQDGSIYGLVRDGTNFVMREFTAAANGTGWALDLLSTNFAANSAGRFIQLASGRIVAIARPNSLTSATLYWRKSRGVWSEVYLDAMGVDATTGVYIYASILEPTPGIMTVIYSPQFGSAGATWAFVRCRAEWPEWQLIGDMPSSLLPLTTSVDPLATVQFTATGPGNVDFTIQTNNSGGSINATTGLYTAGSTGGVSDTVRATNLNAFFLDATVSINGSSVTPPTSIDASNLTVWWDAAQGLNLSGGTLGAGDPITTWTSADTSARVLTAVAGPTSATSLNGNLSVNLNGTSQYFTALSLVMSDLVAASSWTVGFTFKDTGSIADTGVYFLNAAMLTSVSDAVVAIGTTATQVYAGQDGTAGHYDIALQSAGNVHYVVAQYDAVAGKIFLSVDGGAFDAGTTVSAAGASANPLYVGRSGVDTKFFKGSMGQLAVWKSKLAGANLTALKAFLADSIA